MKYKILLILSLFIALSSCEGVFNPDPADGDISGIWDVLETSPTYGTQNYDVQISYINDNSVRIFNFFGLGSWVSLEADLNDKIISFENKVVESHRFSGQGVIEESNDIINFQFTVEEISSIRNFSPENVSAVFTKN